MSSEVIELRRFAVSLLGALIGIGFVGLSIYLGVRDDFLAKFILNGGDGIEYIKVFMGINLFLIGILLIGAHVWKEGVGDDYYGQNLY